MGQSQAAHPAPDGARGLAREARTQRPAQARRGEVRARQLGRGDDAGGRRNPSRRRDARQCVDLCGLLWLDQFRPPASRLVAAQAHAQSRRRLHPPRRYLFDRGRPGDPAPYAGKLGRLRRPGQHARHHRRPYGDAGGVRRAVAAHGADRSRRHRRASARNLSPEDRRSRHPHRPRLAAEGRYARLGRCRMVADPPEHRYGADARPRRRDRQGRPPRRRLPRPLHQRRRSIARAISTARPMASARMRPGPRRSAGSMPRPFANWRGASSIRAACSP